MSSAVTLATVVDTPLSLDRVLDAVRSPGAGGIALFVGVVRDVDGGQGVTSLDYSAHPSAESSLRECAERVATDHPGVTLAVEHRTGHLDVGDLAVVVAAAAVHRHPALRACAQLIDNLKETVPIWKRQQFTSGTAEWVGLP